MPRELPSPELLRKLLRYDPDTGKLFWRERSIELFSDGKQSAAHNCSIWNGKFAGKQAFLTSHSAGYFSGAVFDSKYLAHRVIWAIVHGGWPANEIDHINGNKRDNRITNLRSATRLQNCRNAAMKSNNTSGYTGVDFVKNKGKWRVRITLFDGQKTIGYFEAFDDAVAARKRVEVGSGYTERHGKCHKL